MQSKLLCRERRLARDLTARLGRGFAHSNLNYMRKFYLVSQKLQTSGLTGKVQISMYLNYFKSEVGGRGDAEPVGIVLGANKDDLVVQYATQGISNRLFVSKYQLYLPDENQLRGKLAALLDHAPEGKGPNRKTRQREED